MITAYRLPRRVLDETSPTFGGAARAARECQILWVGPWATPSLITEAGHIRSSEARVGGFVLDDAWLSDFWLRLANENLGVRIQVHTHPAEAFHSSDRRQVSNHPQAGVLVIGGSPGSRSGRLASMTLT